MKKSCWVAKHYKKGWRAGIAYGNGPIKYIPHWFKDEDAVKVALNANIVFIHMADEVGK